MPLTRPPILRAAPRPEGDNITRWRRQIAASGAIAPPATPPRPPVVPPPPVAPPTPTEEAPARPSFRQRFFGELRELATTPPWETVLGAARDIEAGRKRLLELTPPAIRAPLERLEAETVGREIPLPGGLQPVTFGEQAGETAMFVPGLYQAGRGAARLIEEAGRGAVRAKTMKLRAPEEPPRPAGGVPREPPAALVKQPKVTSDSFQSKIDELETRLFGEGLDPSVPAPGKFSDNPDLNHLYELRDAIDRTELDSFMAQVVKNAPEIPEATVRKALKLVYDIDPDSPAYVFSTHETMRDLLKVPSVREAFKTRVARLAMDEELLARGLDEVAFTNPALSGLSSTERQASLQRFADQAEAIDAAISKAAVEIRPLEVTTQQAEALAASRMRLRAPEEPPTTGQPGFGIGERARQGELVIGGEAAAAPLADAERLAAAQRRRELVARGQRQLPEPARPPVSPAAAEPAVAAVEPWQMTPTEYSKTLRATTTGMKKRQLARFEAEVAREHADAVQAAIGRSELIPAKVLEAYPERASDYLGELMIQRTELGAEELTHRVAQVEEFLKLRRLPKGLGTKADLRLLRDRYRGAADGMVEVEGLQALTPDDPTAITAAIESSLAGVDAELGLRTLPFHGGAKNLRPGASTNQLEAERLVYDDALAAMREPPPRPPVPPRAAEVSPAAAERPVEPAGGPPVPTPRKAARTPRQATEEVKAVQQEGQRAPDSIPPAEAERAHIEFGAPDGPRPPDPPAPPGGRPPRDKPADIMRQIADKATGGELPDQTLLRLHEAAISSETRRTGIIAREGNAKLKALGIGVTRRGQLVPRTADIPELDALYNALHNPSKVASGAVRVPERFQGIYDDLRQLTDWEQAARLDFDPAMATVEDYFYRGWKPPQGAFADVRQGRPLVKTPAFKKPRVNATYQEMREAGFEPLFWNPYQQWGLSRMQGTKYREQMQLVEHLKGMGEDFARPHAGGPIPQGWRVPEVGPAFEGKPFATVDAAGEPTAMYTRRWIVPDRVANTLENIYGKRPNLGKLIIGPKTVDPLTLIDAVTFLPKRAKLFGSFFQQIDFLTRAGAGSWTRMVDAAFAGQPLEAVKALARYPKTAATIIRANFSPGFRQSLARQLDSTVPLVKGRPGVHLKGVSDAGLSTFDPAMFRWEEMDKVVREVAQETGFLAKGRAAARLVGNLESMMRRGLFDGVYPAAMITDIRNNIAPMLARMYPRLKDAQLNGTIARIINMKYSSIPASQSVLQNRVLRETLRRVFFSIGESEGLLRQAASTVGGPNKKFWAKHWLGTYLFITATAAAIHYAATGEDLPLDRFVPISKDKWGPLPFGYNTRFAAPTIPLKGRGGTELTLDVVGQMDTALRVLNPGFFLTARESVPMRAITNQVSGTDFFGTPINEVGPGGVLSRTAQLAQDLFSPIGLGGISEEVARRNIPGAERIINEGETRLGLMGLGVQATGVNLRAATREQRLRSLLGDDAKTTLATLDSLGLDLGYVTRRFDTRLGTKGGEITLTSEEREQLQWLTDDMVVQGLVKLFASGSFQRTSKEQQKEATKKRQADMRARARARFRIVLRNRPREEGPQASPVSPPVRRVPVPAGGVAPSSNIERWRQQIEAESGR